MFRSLFFTVLFLLGLTGVGSSQSRFSNQPYAGFSLGSSIIHERLPEGFAYTPLSILTELSLWNKGSWTIYSEVQIASGITSALSNAFEMGLNLGVKYRLPLTTHLSVTAAIGSGPHFVVIQTDRQADGFIFSDNFELGWQYLIAKTGTRFRLSTRFRHISNAGLRSPNGGIDNLFFLVGFAQTIRG